MDAVIDPANPATWPASTIVVRCGSTQGVPDLAERLAQDGSWSVYTGPGIELEELARSCRNNRVRRTTIAAVLAGGGSLQPSEGPPHHHELRGLTAESFDAILGEPEPNPVATEDRWMP